MYFYLGNYLLLAWMFSSLLSCGSRNQDAPEVYFPHFSFSVNGEARWRWGGGLLIDNSYEHSGVSHLTHSHTHADVLYMRLYSLAK